MRGSGRRSDIGGACERRLPAWLTKPHADPAATDRVRQTLVRFRLNTVCDAALCPNRVDCLSRGTATFMVLGDVCTRGCAFCAVRRGEPRPVDANEPGRVADAASALGLSFVVVTSVTRDDLPDGGAAHIAETVRQLRRALPSAGVEVLVPDFRGRTPALDAVLRARPDVLGHNIETVRRLYPVVRAGADYGRSLAVLSRAARRGTGLPVKSALMLGLGETREEVEATLDDLWHAGVRIVCVGQYLRPSQAHVPVSRYVPPSEFGEVEASALSRGFAAVVAGPFVRSSYGAEAAARSCVGRAAAPGAFMEETA